MRLRQFNGANRLSGHTLAFEGAAHVRRLIHIDTVVYERPSSTWAGVALCSCGAVSEVLPSNYQRKRWHREHKDAIRAEQV